MLQDAAPTVILTTSGVAGVVADYVRSDSASAPAVVEVDTLDFSGPTGSGLQSESVTDTAYFQYTSGSTRRPAGVMLSHRNLLAN